MKPEQEDPLLSDAKSARILVGLSGASVYLLTTDGRTWVVRKGARTPQNNHRLKLQSAKQQKWRELVSAPIHTPQILNEGEIDGRYYYDMEYIRGLDAVSYLSRATYSEVAAFTGQLCTYIEEASTLPELIPAISPSLFDAAYAKISEVWNKFGELPCDTAARMFLSLNVLRKESGNIRPTLCHGDLTLENLMVTADGKIYAVDLLDFAFPHYWLDIAKLHQDLTGGWYMRHGASIAPCVTDYISGRLLKTAEKLNPLYSQVHNLLLVLAYIRILPYAQNEEQLSFIKRRIVCFTRLLENVG